MSPKRKTAAAKKKAAPEVHGAEGGGYPVLDFGQESVQAFLDACMRGRVPALLFTGTRGVGKEYTAVELGRKLCCDRTPTCTLGGTLCPSCTNAVRLEHPEIQLIYPTPTQGGGEKPGDDEMDIGKVLEEKRRDIFGSFEFTKKASIRVARSRAVITRAYTKPVHGPYHVFIFADAHLMREEAQNALLKLVEEPPAHCVVILLTDAPDAILYTIRSRCQRVRFGPLRPDIIESVLVSYYGIAPKAAARVAAISQGSIKRARLLAADQDEDERRDALDIAEKLPSATDSWVIARALGVGQGASRDRVARFLHEFSVVLRDMMAADPALYINVDQAARLESGAAKWDRARLPAVLDRIARTRDDVLRRNLNTNAALVHLLLDIRHMGC